MVGGMLCKSDKPSIIIIIIILLVSEFGFKISGSVTYLDSRGVTSVTLVRL